MRRSKQSRVRLLTEVLADTKILAFFIGLGLTNLTEIPKKTWLSVKMFFFPFENFLVNICRYGNIFRTLQKLILNIPNMKIRGMKMWSNKNASHGVDNSTKEMLLQSFNGVCGAGVGNSFWLVGHTGNKIRASIRILWTYLIWFDF